MHFRAHTVNYFDEFGKLTHSNSISLSYDREEIEHFGYSEDEPGILIRETDEGGTKEIVGSWVEGAPADLSFVCRGPR